MCRPRALLSSTHLVLLPPLPLQNHPQAGEDLSAQLIAVLKANPDVYAKTVFLINYDEGGESWWIESSCPADCIFGR
jgi:hypothetical protein